MVIMNLIHRLFGPRKGYASGGLVKDCAGYRVGEVPCQLGVPVAYLVAPQELRPGDMVCLDKGKLRKAVEGDKLEGVFRLPPDAVQQAGIISIPCWPAPTMFR